MFKKKKKEEPPVKGIIDLTEYLDDDIMETDPLGSYTGVPFINGVQEEYDVPVQDADDL